MRSCPRLWRKGDSHDMQTHFEAVPGMGSDSCFHPPLAPFVNRHDGGAGGGGVADR
jgi:hypothetical protein